MASSQPSLPPLGGPTKSPLVAPTHIHKKRLIVCCDGTGNSSIGKQTVPTNVTRFCRALMTSDMEKKDHGLLQEIPQVVLYQAGVGTEGISAASNTIASMFGSGLDLHVAEAYNFFANNWEPEDEIFLFGFSRGAFTARAIATLICTIGLLQKHRLQHFHVLYDKFKEHQNTPEGMANFKEWMKKNQSTYEPYLHKEVKINIMGLWDTVGSLGIPETWISDKLGLSAVRKWWNSEYGYHDTSFPISEVDPDLKASIVRTYQALALDDTRISFTPTLLYYQNISDDSEFEAPKFQQCWFAGAHADVGGGYERAHNDISDISFAWMQQLCTPYLKFREAEELSLEFKSPTLEVKAPDAPSIKTEDDPKDLGWGLSKIHDEYNTWKFKLGGYRERSPGQYFIGKVAENGKPYLTKEKIHASVRYRMLRDPTYRPPALAGFKPVKDDKGWKWVKTVELKGKAPVTVEIPEWKVGKQAASLQRAESSRLESMLVTPDVEQVLLDDAATKAFIPIPDKKSWLG